jgi:hypothetical protein
MQNNTWSPYILNIRNTRAIFTLILSFITIILSSESLSKEKIICITGIIYSIVCLVLEMIGYYIWICFELSKGNKEEIMVLTYGMIPKLYKYYIFNIIQTIINIIMLIVIIVLMTFIILNNYINIMLFITLLSYTFFNIITNSIQIYFLLKHIDYIKTNCGLLNIMLIN